MRPRRFFIKRIRAIDKLEIDIPERGSLIMLKGDNQTGKSTALSIIESMLSGNNNPPEGDDVCVGDFVGADGIEYTVMLDTRKNIKGTRYSILSNGSIKTMKPTEISDLFGYNSMTIEKFISLSDTAEGRRKQRDFVILTKGQDALNQYNDILKEEKDTYDIRRDTKVLLNSLVNPNESIEQLEEDRNRAVNKYQELLKELNEVKAKGEEISRKLDVKKKWMEYSATLDGLTRLLDSIRLKKEQFLNGYRIENIEISEDGVYIHSDDKRLLLDDNNVATSLGINTVAKIIALANKKTPVVLINRLESLNSSMRASLDKFCKENDVCVIAEDMDETYGKVVAEIYA